jgi:hypothetical protein
MGETEIAELLKQWNKVDVWRHEFPKPLSTLCSLAKSPHMHGLQFPYWKRKKIQTSTTVFDSAIKAQWFPFEFNGSSAWLCHRNEGIYKKVPGGAVFHFTSHCWINIRVVPDV